MEQVVRDWKLITKT